MYVFFEEKMAKALFRCKIWHIESVFGQKIFVLGIKIPIFALLNHSIFMHFLIFICSQCNKTTE